MSDEALILFANDAFYNAFAARDFPAMEDIWTKDTEPTCVHPGWPPLVGRNQVMNSWRDILNDDESSPIACTNAQAYRCGEGAYVTCHEHMGRSFLIATNIFLRENGQWKIIHHQAGAALSPNRTTQATSTLQ
ncbi:MAG: nuclear transport factor 2 family protein [Rhodospirillaceae bacterium]|jgi:ketosteroid isomerase-like protein|nr:nuclear transport factor 2 family protein [Rhodospirillaceae bacterium]